jgi:hypothetical protein
VCEISRSRGCIWDPDKRYIENPPIFQEFGLYWVRGLLAQVSRTRLTSLIEPLGMVRIFRRPLFSSLNRAADSAGDEEDQEDS